MPRPSREVKSIEELRGAIAKMDCVSAPVLGLEVMEFVWPIVKYRLAEARLEGNLDEHIVLCQACTDEVPCRSYKAIKRKLDQLRAEVKGG